MLQLVLRKIVLRHDPEPSLVLFELQNPQLDNNTRALPLRIEPHKNEFLNSLCTKQAEFSKLDPVSLLKKLNLNVLHLHIKHNDSSHDESFSFYLAIKSDRNPKLYQISFEQFISTCIFNTLPVLISEETFNKIGISKAFYAQDCFTQGEMIEVFNNFVDRIKPQDFKNSI